MNSKETLLPFVWVQIHLDNQRRKYRTGGAETRRSEEEKMFAHENESFPPLTSASPRLLFDFLLALMSPRLEKPKRNDADPNLIFA